jgi:hypothetical protein
MSLDKISFVGVDKDTDLEQLLQFPNNCEFGILFSDSKNGIHQRYPTAKKSLRYLLWAKDNKVSSSLHLCGSSVDRCLNKDPSILELVSLAGRIQLNLNIKKYDNYDKLSDNIIEIFKNYHVILQKNQSKIGFNKIVCKKLEKCSHGQVSFLHDGSGGFGREISKIEKPDDKWYTGYAGGICPENVIKIISMIDNANIENKPYYIDMESGIRENNVFSIKKCLEIKQLLGANNILFKI